jgi:triphosphatase
VKIELTVDKGKVVAVGRSSPLCEIELELKKGKSADLFALAGAIGKVLSVALASKSKAGRGYDLIAKSEGGPVDGEPIAITGDVTWARAFCIIGRACLYQIAANEHAVRSGDAEGVHQMRIGVRRLRTAISLFKGMLAGAQTEAMKSELKWLTGELGPARELDVFVKRVVNQNQDGNTSGPSLGGVAADFSKRRGQALESAAEAVASPRFRQLVLDAAAWTAIGEWTRNENELKSSMRERPVVDAASEELSRRIFCRRLSVHQEVGAPAQEIRRQIKSDAGCTRRYQRHPGASRFGEADDQAAGGSASAARAPREESLRSGPPFRARGCALCIGHEAGRACLCRFCQD